MPIVNDTPSTPPVQKPIQIQVTSPEFKGVTVDSKYTPLKSLIAQIEGAAWSVNYYSQVLGTDNALSGQNLNRSAAIQQYRMIADFELKVTQPLTYSQDTTTKQQTVKGQANLYPGTIIPNEGDCFLADVGDGREGLFEIRNSERRMWMKDAAYVVDYEMVDWSEKDNRVADLNRKVVQRFNFKKDFLLHGQDPLITSDENDQLEKLNGYWNELRDHYFNRFFSRELGTLVLPGQEYPIYDPLLTRAVLAMFRDDLHPNIKHIRELNVDEDDNYGLPNIWTALLNKRRRDLKVGVMDKIGLVTARGFSVEPRMNSIRYSGVRYVTYPANPNKSEDYLRKDYTKPLADYQFKLTAPKFFDLVDLLPVHELYGLYWGGGPTPPKPVRSINPITHDSYVFSQAFYANAAEGQSFIELLMQQYLDDKAMNLHALTVLCGSYPSWGSLEQFYQLPFVMAMIRAATRRM